MLKWTLAVDLYKHHLREISSIISYIMNGLSYKKTFKSELVDLQMNTLKDIVDRAQERIDFDAAHNEEILLGIRVVEIFLRQKHRICYGGQAINAYLPSKHKFYKPETSIPDYDFLTPAPKSDVDYLVKKLKDAGLKEIGVREGMHKGTTKLYVNYVPVADITEMNPYFYKKLAHRANIIEGITYIDPNTLRMMMYLELSRPRGEVSRWPKVFERLMLLNTYAPMNECNSHIRRNKSRIPYYIRKEILNYVIGEGRILAGGEITSYYKARLHGERTVDWFFEQRNPVIFYSPDIKHDINILFSKLGNDFTLKSYPAEADFFPPIDVVSWKGRPVFLIIQQSACHSYNKLQMSDGRQLNIASIETLITLYLSLTFRKQLEKYMEFPILCLVQELIEISMLYRKNYKESRASKAFPFISIECSGYQKQMPTLLKEKVERIRIAKNAVASSKSSIRKMSIKVPHNPLKQKKHIKKHTQKQSHRDNNHTRRRV